MTHDTVPRIRTRMTARSVEGPRASSPLELLFDLTFVVAIAQLAVALAHEIAADHALDGIGPFLMVFFAIWWAWMNFTWFASSYDTDDVPYRVLTMVQMAGVLVLAAGVPSAFEEGDFTAGVVGYFIMRVGLVLQWVRAAVEDPSHRPAAVRYAVGVSVVQLGWLLRLFLDEAMAVPSFLLLVLLELAVPLWSRRAADTTWHPHHIAERYGLFTIIVLGESVLAATTGVQASIDSGGISAGLVTVAIAGLVLLFSLWWLYFLEPAGEGLERRRGMAFAWGYGHFGIFAALAALGAGLEVAVERTGHHLEVEPVVVAYAVAIPVAVYLVLLWGVHAPLVERLVIDPAVILPAAALLLVLPLLTVAGVGLPVVVAAMAVVCAGIVTVTLLTGQRAQARTGAR